MQWHMLSGERYHPSSQMISINSFYIKDSVQNKKWSGIQEDKIAWTKPIIYNRWKKQSTRLLGIDFNNAY